MPPHAPLRHVRPLLILLLAFVILPGGLGRPASAAPAAASWLDGRWAMGEVDGDDFDVLVEFSGGRGTFSSREGKKVIPVVAVAVDASSAPLFRTQFPQVHGTRPGPRARILLHSRNQGLMWMDYENSLFRMRRIGTLPEVLRGSWQVARRTENMPRSVDISDDFVTFTSINGEVERLKAFPLAQASPSIDLVVQKPDDKESLIMHFQPLPDGSVLVWKAEHSDYLILHRTGLAPEWTPAPRR